MQTNPLIQLNKLYKKYPNNTSYTLANVNMSLYPSQLCCITGVSGVGKSTLLQILGLLEDCTSGERLTFFEEKNSTKIRLNYIGHVYQNSFLLKDFSVIENVMLPALLRGEKKSAVYVKAMNLLEKVSLIDIQEYMPQALSKGQAQRVAIARALINAPKLIIADEPTANLDKKNALQVIKLLKMATEQEVCCVFSTHDTSLLKFCNMHYTINEGSVKKLNSKPM